MPLPARLRRRSAACPVAFAESTVPDRILLIDDDRRLAASLETWMRPRGVALTARHTLAAGQAVLRRGPWDALLLDLMLPDGDGVEACRGRGETPPALPGGVLTARGELTDRVLGLESGADDYLPKPFDPHELLARIRALLRRSRRGPRLGEVLRFGSLAIDRGAMVVRRDGVVRVLTAHQFAVLWALASRAGRVLDRAQLSAAVSGGPGDVLDRTLDVHISRIRAAIEPDPREPVYIRTVRGAGYVFTDPGK